MGGEQRFAGQRVAVLARGFDRYRLAAKRSQDVTIGRIAGDRDRHAIAGLEQSKEGQNEPTR